MTDARDVWLLMSDLVLDNTRRREVSEALDMSFGRARAIRRLARRPMSMREFADAMDIDPPNATVLVADLEAQGRAPPRPRRRRRPAQRSPGARDSPPPTAPVLVPNPEPRAPARRRPHPTDG